MTAFSLGRLGARKRVASQPIEYSLLLTATLCLLAFGVVMVFSASSTTSLLGTTGDSAYYLKRTILFGAFGLIAMKVLSGPGARAIKPLTPLILALAMIGLVVVLLPGFGMTINGAKRWIGAGPLQIQPSEIAKLAIVLYGAKLLADRPTMVRSVRTLMPFLFVVAVACLLVVVEPDMGTAMIACFATAAMLLAAGIRMRHLAVIGAVVAAIVLLAIVVQPYRMERLTGFVNPSSDPSSVGYQATQAKIALGSGGVFGVGLGQSVQKAYFLPEAHTDMIAAIIGEELGFAGLTLLVGLYGLFGYAGLRTAQRAKDRYGKLLAAGITSLILVQALINLFAVMGLAPLTGVPLPFVSYGNSSLLVTLAAVGLLLGIARNPAKSAARPASTSEKRADRLRVVAGSGARRAPTERTAASAKGRNSSRGNRGARRPSPGRRRRASR
jgi:cell division protein FtsW